jgi:Domain of unknown function (DUF4431)
MLIKCPANQPPHFRPFATRGTLWRVRRLLAAMVTLPAFVASVGAQNVAANPSDTAACLRVDVDTVSLSGTIEVDTFPGRPNYESIADGDEAEAYFFLVLPAPFCVRPDSTAPDRQPIDGGNVVQLFLDQRGFDRLRPSLTRHIALRGLLWEGFSGHHHTPYLLTVVY